MSVFFTLACVLSFKKPADKLNIAFNYQIGYLDPFMNINIQMFFFDLFWINH